MSTSQITDITGKSIPSFTTVKYVTKDGEKCIATKNDGVVTIQGDKNGVRQMPMEEFVQKELMQNVKTLGAQAFERNPEKDAVSFSGNDDRLEEYSLTRKNIEKKYRRNNIISWTLGTVAGLLTALKVKDTKSAKAFFGILAGGLSGAIGSMFSYEKRIHDINKLDKEFIENNGK